MIRQVATGILFGALAIAQVFPPPGGGGGQGPPGPPGGPNFRQTFVDLAQVDLAHNANTLAVIPFCWDAAGQPIHIEPNQFKRLDANTVRVTFIAVTSGECIVNTSGGGSSSQLVNSQTGTTYTYLDGDRGKLVTHSNGSAIAGTLPQANGSTFVHGWFMDVQNRGAGTLTITPTTSTIDGAASLALTTGQGVRIVSNGSNYFTQRGMTGGAGGPGDIEGVTATGGLGGGGTSGTVTVFAERLANAQTGTTYTVLTGDRGKFITASNASATAWTLPQAGASFPDGWSFWVKNIGVGNVTITPTTSTISGAANIVLSTGELCLVSSNGTNYEASCNRLTSDSTIVLTKTRTGTQVSIDTSNLNLTYAQLTGATFTGKVTGTPTATTAGFRIVCGLPTAQSGGDLFCTAGGQFGHFDGLNIRLTPGIVGSGTTVPTTPVAGRFVTWGPTNTFDIVDSGLSVQAAGTAGTNPINAGTSTELARKDHEHRVPWQAGLGFEAPPAAAEFALPIPVGNQCGGSIDAVSISITALTKGSSTLTFNVIRYNAAGVSQGNLFSATQTYSEAGDNRQSFTVNQNGTGIGATDYFRANFLTVNGQDDFTFTVQGKCKNVV